MLWFTKKALVVSEKKQVVTFDEKVIDDYLFGTDTKLDKRQIVLFKQTAIQMKLNPFLKEIYALPFEEKYYDQNSYKMVSYDPPKYKMSIVIGYPTFLKRGERIGDLEYWAIETKGKIDHNDLIKSDYVATVIIKRKSRSKEFRWEVDFVEVAPRDKSNKIVLRALWKKQPKFQTRKCCFAQGFRIYFPEEMGTLPCIKEEIESDLINVTPVVEKSRKEKVEVEKEKKKKEEGQKAYKLPDEIFPETLCNLGKYKNNPIKYGDMPLDELQLLYEKKAENPDALTGVLNHVITGMITTAAGSINYTEKDINTIVKTLTKCDNLLDLTWEDKLKIYHRIKNVANKKK